MNGPHDLGGAMGFGPVVPEPDEAVFHAAWEKRAFAITLAAGFLGRWNIDMARSARESLPPARYLASSYYEIWALALERLLVDRGLVGADEIAARRALRPPSPGVKAVPAGAVAAVLARGGPTERNVTQAPRFAVGDAVRALNMHPLGHVRLPRYVRGKLGKVIAVHEAHVFPDTNARGDGEHPQRLYTVAFSGAELWGPDTTAASVRVDCWESYLARAESVGADVAA
jgi:nitrile hydratase beta subunit